MLRCALDAVRGFEASPYISYRLNERWAVWGGLDLTPYSVDKAINASRSHVDVTAPCCKQNMVAGEPVAETSWERCGFEVGVVEDGLAAGLRVVAFEPRRCALYVDGAGALHIAFYD